MQLSLLCRKILQVGRSLHLKAAAFSNSSALLLRRLHSREVNSEVLQEDCLHSHPSSTPASSIGPGDPSSTFLHPAVLPREAGLQGLSLSCIYVLSGFQLWPIGSPRGEKTGGKWDQVSYSQVPFQQVAVAARVSGPVLHIRPPSRFQQPPIRMRADNSALLLPAQGICTIPWSFPTPFSYPSK